MFDVAGKVVIVTGGNKGIGEGIAKTFAKAGAKVVIWARNEADNKRVCDEIVAAGDECAAFPCDISDEEQVNVAVQKTLDTYNGRIDVLVHGAGIMLQGDTKKVPAESVSGFRKVVEVNLIGAYACAAAVFPIMRKQRFGRIIYIASAIHQRMAAGRVPSYTASKTGEIGLVRHLAMEGGEFGITVNAICPGSTLTPMLQTMISSPEQLAWRKRQIPTARLATPEDHAYLAIFLASEEAAQINGQAINVDGGQTLPWVDRDAYFQDVEDR